MTLDTLVSLYQHGALAPAILLALYLLLRWASSHVPWLEVPNRAHYVAIALTGLSIVAPAAAAGQLPSLAVVLTAVAAMATLAMPGLTASSKTPQSGKVSLVLLSLLALVAVASCAWWSSSGKPAAATAGKTAEACAVSDLENYGSDLAQRLAGGDYEAQLSAFAKAHNFTQDAMNCLVSGLLAGLGAAIAGEQHGEPTPLYLHARAYLDAHAKRVSAVGLSLYSAKIAAAWLDARDGCDPPNERPAVDCRPFSAEVYDGCRWGCR